MPNSKQRLGRKERQTSNGERNGAVKPTPQNTRESSRESKKR